MTNEAMIVKTTNRIAAAGLIMPAWLPTLTEMSSAAGLLVPILSAAWLVVQIITHLYRRDDEDGE